MVVGQGLIESDQAIRVAHDFAIFRVIVLHGSRCKIDFVTFHPVEAFLDKNLRISPVDWSLETCLSAPWFTIELDIAHRSEDLVTSGDSAAQD